LGSFVTWQGYLIFLNSWKVYRMENKEEQVDNGDQSRVYWKIIFYIS
jgi:hypothetical protein